MPVHIPPDDIPASGTPMIISESPTHIVVAVEIATATLSRHRRFLELLLAAAATRNATQRPSTTDRSRHRQHGGAGRRRRSDLRRDRGAPLHSVVLTRIVAAACHIHEQCENRSRFVAGFIVAQFDVRQDDVE